MCAGLLFVSVLSFLFTIAFLVAESMADETDEIILGEKKDNI